MRRLNDKASFIEVEFRRVEVKELLREMLVEEEDEKEDVHSPDDHEYYRSSRNHGCRRSSEHDHEASYSHSYLHSSECPLESAFPLP